MFLSIDDKLYNVLYAQELRKEEKDGKYLIIYTWVNGYELAEEFDTDTDRDAKYDEVLEAGIGGGTSDYADLDNKPKINSITLSGNKSAHDLGLASTEDISTVYSYKGTVSTYSSLPSSGNKTGDVYNIEQADSTHGIKAGDNVAWNGSNWDKLGGDIDLSGKQDVIDANNKLSFAYVNTNGDDREFVRMIPENSQNSPWVIDDIEPGVYHSTSTDFTYNLYVKVGATNLVTIENIHGPFIVLKKPSSMSDQGYVAKWDSIQQYYNICRSHLWRNTNNTYGTATFNYVTVMSASSGNQLVYGVKTFDALPESSATPTTNNQLVNKSYVDSKAGGAPLRLPVTSNNNPFDLTTAEPGFYYVKPASYGSMVYIKVANNDVRSFAQAMELRVFKKYSDWQTDDVVAEVRTGGSANSVTASMCVMVYPFVVSSSGSINTNNVYFESSPENLIKMKDEYVASNIAPLFSTTSTYDVGDYVIRYDGNGYRLYKCTTAVTVAGNWNASSWVQKTVEEMVSSTSFDPTIITGYNASKTQILKHVNGTLTWVDDYVDADNQSY